MRQKLEIFLFKIAIFLGLLSALLIVLYIYAAPIAKNYIETKAAKYHIKIQSRDIGLNGEINLANQHFVLKNLGDVFISSAKIRPPLSFLSGFAQLHNVKIIGPDIKANIPLITLHNISKNPNILDKIAKYNIGSINIPSATANYKDKNIAFNNIKISHIYKGQVKDISLGASKLSMPDINANIGYSAAQNINLAALVNLAQNLKDKAKLIQLIKNLQHIGFKFKNIKLQTAKGNANLGALFVHIDDWQHIIPSNFQIKIEKANFNNLTILNKLHILNYETAAFSGALAFAYHENTQIFSLKQLKLDLNQIAQLEMNSELAGMNAEVFDLNTDIIANLANKLQLHKLNLTYLDKGLAPYLIDFLSTQENLNKSDVEDLVYTILEKSPGLLLDNQTIGPIIGKTLLDIAKHPQLYSLAARAKDNITIADLTEEKDINKLNKKIELHVVRKAL